MDLLEGSTDFITVRQITALKALRLFLEYAQPDDLVRNTKKIIHYLMVVYMNKTEALVRNKVLSIIELLGLQLPSADIYLDVLLARLDNKNLTLEGNGSVTVMVIVTFLNTFLSVGLKDATLFKRVNTALERPYLKPYIADQKETEKELEHIKATMCDGGFLS